MQTWDCHVHTYNGTETADDILRAMDAAGLTRISFFSQHPGNIRELLPPPSAAEFRAAIDSAAAIQAADPDRIYALFWADPRTEGILDLVEYALVERGLHGVKMIPNHWYASDEFLYPLYEKMEAVGKPIHFHSGILYAFGDSSRFCRPVFYEALINFPRLKFAMAHISWPWTDECLALFGHFRSVAGTRQQGSRMWIDCSRGTPDIWRTDALHKATTFCGAGRLMYGTDASGSLLGRSAPPMIQKDVDLLNELGLSDEDIHQFFWGAAEALFDGKDD
ncbi:MAG: amidohydrolase family protein [Armatimonadia bacterium]